MYKPYSLVFVGAFVSLVACTQAPADDAEGESSAAASEASLVVSVGFPNGHVCSAGGQCSSSNCVDGVCCNTACGGGDTSDCQACSVAQGAASDGTCGPRSAATVCRHSAQDGCNPDETCNGSSLSCPADVTYGACNYIHATTNSGQTLTGTSVPDFILGGNGPDTLIGLAGGDRLYGQSGDDIFLTSGGGSDIVYGGPDNDTVDYSSATGAVYVELTREFVHETGLTSGTVTASTPVVSNDVVIEVENAIGSAYGDRLYGTTGDNVFTPGAGDDIVFGGAGSDTVTYSSATGAVFVDLTGQFVNETALTSGTVTASTPVVSKDFVIEVENATGSGYGDRLYGTSASNSLTGAAGDDILYGLDGGDFLSGGDGADVLIGGNGSDLLGGGTGADQFVFIYGDTGADLMLDFVSGTDKIYVHGFPGYPAGSAITLAPAGPPGLTATFRYDQGSGYISFDRGDRTNVIFAVVFPGTALDGSDFVSY